MEEYKEVSVSFTESELRTIAQEIAQAMYPKVHWGNTPEETAQEAHAVVKKHLNNVRSIINEYCAGLGLDWTNP